MQNLIQFLFRILAAHFGQINMVRYLLENDAAVEKSTNIGYTPLHQAAQQGHTLIINLLLKHKADPNAVTNVSTRTPFMKLLIAIRLAEIILKERVNVMTCCVTCLEQQQYSI